MIYVYSMNTSTGRTTFVYVSDRCLDLFGVEPGIATSDTFDLYYRVHPDDRERYLVEVTSAMKEQRGLLMEVRILNAKGEYRWLRVKSRIQPKAQSGPHRHETLWFGVCDDISDLVKKRSELSEEKSIIETLEAVLSVTFDVTLYIDAAFRITRDSAKLRHFLGLDDESLTGHDFREFIAHGRAEFAEYMSQCMERRTGHRLGPQVASREDTANFSLHVAENEIVACEVYGSGLPWPLDGNYLVGIKVGDLQPNPASPSTVATEDERRSSLSVAPVVDGRSRRVLLLKVGFQGDLLDLAAQAGEIASNRDTFFSHASVGEVEQALETLPQAERVTWRIYVLLCLEFGNLDALLRHRRLLKNAESKLLVFLAVCELLIGGLGDITCNEICEMYEDLTDPYSSVERCVATVQLAIVCDALGDDAKAVSILLEAFQQGQNVEGDRVDQLIQLQGSILYNLYVLTEENQFMEQLESLMRGNADIAFPEVCFDVVAE
jgi:hypothetical protein